MSYTSGKRPEIVRRDFPSNTRLEIYKLESYLVQINGLKLELSVASQFFEEVIIVLVLVDITISKSVSSFSSRVAGVYKILSLTVEGILLV
ncbi:hypothetical protein C1645_830242 [Glomus cerebriforme]|uniref:Uncharacterized protein n=1 Tax=Glomus cerebriforme TaxID=658196 RepID=A0A397SLN0_9GLOM|nr:hypothetical protein C1645_830242 [Glomus cerebriforme]